MVIYRNRNSGYSSLSFLPLPFSVISNPANVYAKSLFLFYQTETHRFTGLICISKQIATGTCLVIATTVQRRKPTTERQRGVHCFDDELTSIYRRIFFLSNSLIDSTCINVHFPVFKYNVDCPRTPRDGESKFLETILLCFSHWFISLDFFITVHNCHYVIHLFYKQVLNQALSLHIQSGQCILLLITISESL